MWEADEIAQARHRIILRVYILPTHPLFPWGFFFFIKYEPNGRMTFPWDQFIISL